MPKKYSAIFFTNFLAGLFLGIGVDNPETTLIKAFDPIFESLSNEANLMWIFIKVLIVISGIVEFIYLFNDSKSRTVLLMGFISGFIIIMPTLSVFGALLFILGIFLSNRFSK